ncbi:MAG: tryptophan synthase subunit alpha, partial [Gammaproteobacteria bacterium]
CVGFGIRTAEDAAAISSTADGSIVGTVLVSQVEALVNDPVKIPEALQSILKPMREAMDAKA